MTTTALLSACPKADACSDDADCPGGACFEGACVQPGDDAGSPTDAGSEPEPDPVDDNLCELESWCNYNGICNPIDESCTCSVGYQGERCGGCADGFQDNAGDRTCRPDCGFSELNCGAHGSCSDVSGLSRCACDTGFEGTICNRCVAGLVLVGDVCVPSPPDAGPLDAGAGDAGATDAGSADGGSGSTPDAGNTDAG